MLRFESEEKLIEFILSARLPEWQSKLFKRNSDAVQVHSQGQIFYKLNALFPNEHPESKRHRILAFESITESSFGRAANNVNRIFKNSSYTVEASDKTIEALDADNFEGQNFYNWFLDEWVKWSLKEDPNARIVIYPPAYVQETGRPQIVFVASEHLRHLSEDAVVFLSEEESVVEYELEEIHVHEEVFFDQSINLPNIKTVKENTYTPKLKANVKKAVFHAFLHGVGFVRAEQGDKTDNGREWLVSMYEFEDFLPVIDVGGEKGKKKVNKSFLHPFVAFGNLALLQHSQHTAVNFTYSFPRMSEIETPCEAEGCSSGWIEVEPSDRFPDGRKHCGVCGGTGWITPQSPYKIYKKRFDPQGMDGDNKHLEVADVQFYTPPVGILDYSKNEWKSYLDQAETAVYISQRIKTGNIESAKSKEIDRDDLYSFLSRVGKSYFSRMRFTIQALENFLNSNPIQVVVTDPYSYAILTEAEAFDALKTILESNLPIMLKANQVESFINKFVSQSSPIRRFLDVLKLVDPLLFYSSAELTGFKVSGVISVEQYANHVFAYPALQRLYLANKNIFIDKETNAIVEEVKTALLEFKPEPPQDLKTKLTKVNE